MKCSDAENLMQNYIDDDIEYDDIKDLLDHIETCKECRDEFEIRYIMQYGLSDEYDEKHGSYDFIRIINEDIDKARKRIFLNTRRNYIRIVAFSITNWIIFGCILFMLKFLNVF